MNHTGIRFNVKIITNQPLMLNKILSLVKPCANVCLN